MKLHTFDQSLIWHVIFHPGRAPWATRFKHVSLAGYHDETWIHIDLHRSGTSIATIYRHGEVNEYLGLLLQNYTVVRFGPCRGQSKAFLRPMTCVAFVKHVIGAPCGALRPDGLFRSLIADYGSEVLNEAESYQANNFS